MKHSYFKVILTACMLACSAAYAQQDNPDTAVFNSITKAEMQGSQITQIAHYLTDVSGPRLTNSPGFFKAANWAIETMKKWGLVNAALEPWGDFGVQWELQDFSMSMRLPYIQPVRAYANPWSANTNGTVRGAVVLITYPQLTDTLYLSKHISEWKGKFLLLTGGPEKTEANFVPSATRLTDSDLVNLKDSYMVSAAEMKMYKEYSKVTSKINALLSGSGLLAIVGTSGNNTNGTVFVQASGGYKVTDQGKIPEVSMALEDGQKIKRLIQSGHPVELSLNIQAKSSVADTKGYNVVAEIPGTDAKLKAQLVMLGGHLDSWPAATGATDNAAGCIVMMEALRLIDSLHLKPKRTIRIALWSGEEQGLLGSYNYARNHFMDGHTFLTKKEQSKVSVYFNLDNGTGKIRGIYAQNNVAVKPIFEEWLTPFHNVGATTVTLKNTGSTDHLSFDWAGIPGFEFIQDPIDYETRTHHSNMDDYDHLQMDDLKQAAVIVASFVYQASIRPDMLPRKPLVKESFIFDGF